MYNVRNAKWQQLLANMFHYLTSQCGLCVHLSNTHPFSTSIILEKSNDHPFSANDSESQSQNKNGSLDVGHVVTSPKRMKRGIDKKCPKPMAN